MRKLIAFFFVLSVMIVQGCHSPSAPSSVAAAHLTLSNEHPAAGEKITFTYDATGTPLAGKTAIEATVYNFDNKENSAEDIALQADGKLLKGAFTVAANAKAFAFKISNGDDIIDNNKGKGYLYLVYKGAKPVEGAYAAEATVYSGLGRSLQINMDKDLGLSLYKKEFYLHPDNNNDKGIYIAVLANTKAPANIALATQIAAALAKSGNEHNMIIASYSYANLNMQPTADSLKAVIKRKFPDGEFVKTAAQSAVWMEPDPAKKEELYNAFIKKYPETNEKNTIYDRLRNDLAAAYINKGDLKNFYRIEAQIKDKSDLPFALNERAWQWVLKGENLADAQKLSKLSLDLTTEKINNKQYRTTAAKKELNTSYNEYADTYALILFKQGQPAEALKIQQAIMNSEKHPIAEWNEHYALYLQAAGQTQKAIEVIENAIKNGNDNEAMIANLKAMYVKKEGSAKGYDAYFAALKQVALKNLRSLLVKDMINEPAPGFKLNDINGNTVSLASLKGKVVIVDFWATWCGPCKASLPGMQLAVTRYKNNPNVQFLFVDTWEHGNTFLPAVKKFIADNKYSFKVLLDEKDKDGVMAKVVSAYKVDGIPTKFIIDGSGKIRFKKVGFDGSATALADEVSTMIDIAANGATAITTERATASNNKIEGK